MIVNNVNCIVDVAKAGSRVIPCRIKADHERFVHGIGHAEIQLIVRCPIGNVGQIFSRIGFVPVRIPSIHSDKRVAVRRRLVAGRCLISGPNSNTDAFVDIQNPIIVVVNVVAINDAVVVRIRFDDIVAVVEVIGRWKGIAAVGQSIEVRVRQRKISSGIDVFIIHIEAVVVVAAFKHVQHAIAISIGIRIGNDTRMIRCWSSCSTFGSVDDAVLITVDVQIVGSANPVGVDGC